MGESGEEKQKGSDSEGEALAVVEDPRSPDKADEEEAGME